MLLTLLAMGIGSIGGCHKTFRASVAQPNPLVSPNETLRISERISIITGDMELDMPQATSNVGSASMQRSRRYPLHNEASFTVVSRDRLRFHVQIEHKWREWADLTTWYAYLVDDTGRVYKPEVLERATARHLVSMWDYERRSVVRNQFRDIVLIRDDGYRNRQALGSLSLFRGRGDFVFYSRDIFTPEIKRLSLVLERRGLSFVFTWKFDDEGQAIEGGEPERRAARACCDPDLICHAGGPLSRTRAEHGPVDMIRRDGPVPRHRRARQH